LRPGPAETTCTEAALLASPFADTTTEAVPVPVSQGTWKSIWPGET
jgi:hypothetical protein